MPYDWRVHDDRWLTYCWFQGADDRSTEPNSHSDSRSPWPRLLGWGVPFCLSVCLLIRLMTTSLRRPVRLSVCLPIHLFDHLCLFTCRSACQSIRLFDYLTCLSVRLMDGCLPSFCLPNFLMICHLMYILSTCLFFQITDQGVFFHCKSRHHESEKYQ